ncbi:MAG: cysteine desulfurase [Deltaproteobacteria bacterium]|nr:cysteine desulfurase [Deltaproteobacteria bacterium]
MPRIYLDHNATTPVRPEAVEAMQRVLTLHFGNPSSAHWAGSEARDELESARGQVSSLLGVAPDTVVFTSGATESNNTVLRSAAARFPRHGDRIVTCATEHPAVLDAADDLRERGIGVQLLPVDRDGRLDPARFSDALDDSVLLASIMWVNNETGVIQPVPKLAAIAAERGVPFHSDAVQALGKLPLSLAALPLDFASFSAHKLGGPKGVGVLYAREGQRFQPLVRGGPQERRRRPGTENVPGIVGFGAACAAAEADLDERSGRLGALRDRLWQAIESKVPDAWQNGSVEHRVPHTLNVSFPGADSEALVEALDLEGIAVASGAACASGSTEPSHVLLAMGIPPERSTCAIRMSLGVTTRGDEIDHFMSVLPGVVERVRGA